MTYNLEQIEEVCSKATPGPWVWEYVFDGKIQQGLSSKETGERILLSFANSVENSNFIPFSRTALPELVARVRGFREREIKSAPTYFYRKRQRQYKCLERANGENQNT